MEYRKLNFKMGSVPASAAPSEQDNSSFTNNTSDEDDHFTNEASSKQTDMEKELWSAHKKRVILHSFIPVYGLAIIAL